MVGVGSYAPKPQEPFPDRSPHPIQMRSGTKEGPSPGGPFFMVDGRCTSLRCGSAFRPSPAEPHEDPRPRAIVRWLTGSIEIGFCVCWSAL
jgi:hypothetical protein